MNNSNRLSGSRKSSFSKNMNLTPVKKRPIAKYPTQSQASLDKATNGQMLGMYLNPKKRAKLELYQKHQRHERT